MTITFRSDIGAYSGVGRKLTISEADGNIYDLLNRVGTLEGGGAFGLTSIDYDGTHITFNWSDDTSSGPFILPVATFRDAGLWANDAEYHYLDIVTVTNVGIFLVLQDHTSPLAPAPFDPAATVGTDDDPLYRMIGFMPDLTGYVRFQGDWAASTGYFIGDVVRNNLGLFYVAIGHTSGGSFNPNLLSGGNPVYKKIAPPLHSHVIDVSESSYLISVTDSDAYLRFSTGCTVQFPPALDIAIGTEIHLRQMGEGVIVFSPGIGVTLNPQREGYDISSPWVGATITAKYVAADEWDLIGPHGNAVSATA